MADSNPQFSVWQETISTTGHVDQGFQVRFSNGFRVSVTWGHGKYGSGDTAEVLVFEPDGTTQDPDGWVTPEQLVAIMVETAARPEASNGR